MPFHADQLDAPLSRLETLVEALTPSAVMRPAIDRWRTDAAALRFHLKPPAGGAPVLLAVIGGTGTGKSTLVNRLIGVDASATSFRRTFTTGAIAIARDAGDVAHEWLGVAHHVIAPDRVPARGENGSLIVVPRTALGQAIQHGALLDRVTLIDTPDLDGDQPAHHAEADRAFRWAQGLIFLVTPEKYQMTELLPYYRLAARYSVPSLFVMNKCEEQAVVEDYRTQLIAAGVKFFLPPRDGGALDETSPSARAPVFTVPRNDAAYDAPPAENLDSLRSALNHLDAGGVSGGVQNRAADIVGRFEDQILAPLRNERREADRLIVALHDMETPAAGIDVNPVTQAFERRLQQRSVLYLIGPQRMLDRVRQAPGLLVRLPRVAWDYVMRGEVSRGAFSPENAVTREVPDFKALLSDQFSVVQSRLDDLLLASPIAQKWIAASPKSYELSRLAPDHAGKIAEEELADLRAWLEKRWNATPRDTRAVQSLLKYLPGGKKLTAVAESAPYLLVIALIAHHAMFGTDLVVLGGYTLATWLTERLSNEVANRTRAANERIADRFTRLAHEQIQNICTWLDQQAVPGRTIDQLDRAAAELAKTAGVAGAE